MTKIQIRSLGTQNAPQSRGARSDTSLDAAQCSECTGLAPGQRCLGIQGKSLGISWTSTEKHKRVQWDYVPEYGPEVHRAFQQTTVIPLVRLDLIGLAVLETVPLEACA